MPKTNHRLVLVFLLVFGLFSSSANAIFCQVGQKFCNGVCIPNTMPCGDSTSTGCLVGYYGSINSSSGCRKCPEGYTSAAGAVNITNCYKTCTAPCMTCPANMTCTYAPPGTLSGREYYGSAGICTNLQGTCRITSQICNPGYRSYGSSCTECGGNRYYCVNGALYNVSSGYYSTGGTPTTRTGQAQCGGNQYYCVNGVRNSVLAGYYSTGGTSTTRTDQAACGGNQYYCSGGVRKSVSAGYYSTGGTSTTRTGQAQCPAGTYCSDGIKYDCPSSYPDSAAGATAKAQCYRSCTKSCTRQTCPSNATCTHGSSSTSGKYYYGGSCDAPASTCSISISCKSGYYKSGSSCPACTGVSATDLSQSCSRSPTSTELSNAHAYAGTMTGGTQQCTGNHTSGPIGAISASQCTGCSSWGSCSGGTLTITSCAAGYFLNGLSAGNRCLSCTSISATDLSQSCSRNPTSTELSNAHAYAGSISGAKQQCTGKHTGGPAGATSSSQCTGCSSWGSCSGGTLTITSCAAGYYKDGNSCKSCPSGYPNSPDGNTGGITSCYSNTKSRAWTGGQTACAKPSGCASVSCKACSGSACNYVAYSNSAGTGDGTIKSGCSTNNANCQQQLDKPTSASADHYISGSTCPACPDAYPNSAGGNIGQSGCYATCSEQSITGGNRVPVSSTVYYGNNCEYTTVCNDGYNQSSDGVCSQLCDLGFTTLRTGSGLVIPLYSEKLSSPAIHIGYNGGMCYGILESGSGDGINLEYGGQTYHTGK